MFETSSFDITRVGWDPLTLPTPVKTALLILSALIGLGGVTTEQPQHKMSPNLVKVTPSVLIQAG